MYDKNAVFDVEVYDDISVMIVITKMRTVTIKTNDFTNDDFKNNTRFYRSACIMGWEGNCISAESNGGAGIYKNTTADTLWASPDSLSAVPHDHCVQMSKSKAHSQISINKLSKSAVFSNCKLQLLVTVMHLQ